VGFELAGGSVAGGKDVDGDGFLDLVQGTHSLNSSNAFGPGRAALFTVGCFGDAAYSAELRTPDRPSRGRQGQFALSNEFATQTKSGSEGYAVANWRPAPGDHEPWFVAAPARSPWWPAPYTRPRLTRRTTTRGLSPASKHRATPVP
jgi:hypothetical protein